MFCYVENQLESLPASTSPQGWAYAYFFLKSVIEEAKISFDEYNASSL